MAYGRKTGGRTKGTPNRMTASVKGALTEAFDELGGVPTLVEWGKANPTAFYQYWSRLAPKEVGGSVSEPLTIVVRRVNDDGIFESESFPMHA